MTINIIRNDHKHYKKMVGFLYSLLQSKTLQHGTWNLGL